MFRLRTRISGLRFGTGGPDFQLKELPKWTVSGNIECALVLTTKLQGLPDLRFASLLGNN